MVNNPLLKAFEEFEQELYSFDNACDVADRGEPTLAREIEEKATAEIRQMFEETVGLQALMPLLWSELRDSKNIADKLPEFYREIHKARSQARSQV